MIVFSLSFITPLSLFVVFLSASQSRDSGKAADGPLFGRPGGPLASRGPVPGAARAPPPPLCRLPGPRRGDRVSFPAPRGGSGSSGSGDASELCLRKELGKEVSVNCADWRGRRGKMLHRSGMGRPGVVFLPCLAHAGLLSSWSIPPITLQ